MATANDIIRSAIIKTRAVPIGDAIPAGWLTMALDELNMLLSHWAADGLEVLALAEGTFSLVGGQFSYTIGPSGNFNTSRPIEIVSGEIIGDGASSQLKAYPSLFRYDGYTTYPTGRPYEVYYNPVITQGIVLLYPTPDKVYSLHLRSLIALTTIATVESTINLPPEYLLFLSTNLAAHLLPILGGTNPLIIAQADKSRNAILQNNSKRLIKEARFDSALVYPHLNGVTVAEIMTGGA